MSTMPIDVEYEHAVLSRHLGNVQHRLSNLMQEKDEALEALQYEVVRLRADLMIARTHILWGMGMPAKCVNHKLRASYPVRPFAYVSHDLEAARKTICQTGCTGHAHHWLTEDGRCRWSGRACDTSAD